MAYIDFQEKKKQFDSHDFYSILKQYPSQMREGYEIGCSYDFSIFRTLDIRNVVICGMGGSAIGGDFIRVLSQHTSRSPVLVQRNYLTPAFIDEHSIVVVLSYSGGTEESLSAYEDARSKNANMLVITSGGELSQRAERDGTLCVRIPGGLAPRMAFGYLFFPLLVFSSDLEVVPCLRQDISEAINFVRALNEQYSDFGAMENAARDLAVDVCGALPLVYCAQEKLEAVALRWRCQIEENAKTLSYGNVFPELNHNEIVGWEKHPDLLHRFAIIMLREANEDPRIQKRIDTTKEILAPYPQSIRDVRAQSPDTLDLMLELLLLGDWFSYYLALANDVDPFPIEKIMHLKNALSAAQR
jgi:glucose/mannose-6-phosphate isomerase